ncbi:stalk domain-containing protein [Paenibacillus humicola]|uniref:stalk domain-containing protein n=1 Tax=Paenibacillus humicola TaxID=3110540 RepID=UPI00237A24C8|nr:stalk domain-containing protein [Paenibacillus humicola]
MTSNFRKTRIAAALLAGSLAAGTLLAGAAAAEGALPPVRTPYAAAAKSEPDFAGTRIVAVGDSVTVGYEYGVTDRSAIYGYVDRLYEQALYRGRAELQNFGVLGLTTAGLQRWLEAAVKGTPITGEEAQPGISDYPQAAETIAQSAGLRQALEQADLVVMTIGGNDFLPLFDEIKTKQVTGDELKTDITSMLDSYKTALEASLRSILAINPQAEIVFSDQYLPVPDPSTNRLIKVVTADQYAALLDGMNRLRGIVEAVGQQFQAQGSSVRTVDISEPFLGHELMYTSIVRGRGDVHPSDDGYEKIAEAFAGGIWGSYRQPATLAGDAPLRLIVRGQAPAGSKPALKAGTTYLPIRSLAEALGASLSWDNKTKTAVFKANGQSSAFVIGSKTMKIDGQNEPLETPAYIDKATSSAYLPLAALSRGLGFQVVYRQKIKTVFVN